MEVEEEESSRSEVETPKEDKETETPTEDNEIETPTVEEEIETPTEEKGAVVIEISEKGSQHLHK